MEHKNSKIIQVHRATNFNVQLDEAAAFQLEDCVSLIGSYMDGKKVGMGITYSEIEKLMPEVIMTDPTDKEFRKKVEAFFSDMRLPVGITKRNSLGKIVGGGLVLETGKEKSNELDVIEYVKEGKELKEVVNMPLNVHDYITYKFVLNHPRVAKSEKEAAANPTKLWFIYDPDLESKVSMTVNEMKDEALKLYFKTSEDSNKVKFVCELLSNLGLELGTLSTADLQIQYRKLADTKPKEFVSAVNDKLLEMKFIINQCMSKNIVQNIGGRFIVDGEGIELGIGLEAAALYIADPVNSTTLLKLKSLLDK